MVIKMIKDGELVSIIKVKGKEVKLCIDDYGQCYFANYIDDDGKEQEIFFGTYCTEIMDELFYFIDSEFRDLFIKKSKGTLTKEEEERINLYYSQFDDLYGPGTKEIKL